MNWFVNLKTRSKLFLSFGFKIGLFLIIFVLAYRDLEQMQSLQRKISEVEFANVVDLQDIRFNQDSIRSTTLSMLVLKDPQKLASLRNKADELVKNNDELIQKVLERETEPNHIARLKEFDEIRRAFNDTRENQVMPLVFAGKFDEAKGVVTGIQADRNEKIGSIIDELVVGAEGDAKAAVAESSRNVSLYLNILTVLCIAVVIIGTAIAIYLSRIIAGPLQGISETAEKIASGDLTVVVSTADRKDEVGDLARTFRKMIGNMREVNRGIQESVSVLAASASEILSSTTEVASSVTETATAVNETTTTVEEVKQTAQVSNQKAEYVSEAAKKAVQVSQTGGKAMEETVGKMNRIRQQMESIAESIVRLSEQSQAIGEIISTVNDLAEQSNLLAVNASIEAAKAGEHGKGFAVVAQEVRSLAEQSKQATTQVRTILNDIQKATGAAVLATEQGSKTVDEGVRQSAQAGESIKALESSIAEAAQAGMQIAASSQQQLVGMEQVITAMNNIKLASEQNVAGTRQTETAARGLHELGQKLKQLVDQFKV
ncbi:MAG: methyl-accepting chemotaxis protein [Nitrospirota bacterium]